MSSASKRNDDHDAERAPVPPYPGEVAGTWQAFRVTMRDADVEGSNGEEPPPERADEDAGQS
jgi:hypothetical protein